jgi:hypothetical protein
MIVRFASGFKGFGERASGSAQGYLVFPSSAYMSEMAVNSPK